ncbi:alpha/beta-hydrolase [Obba rivulosa]|uniref:Alpha/beta-hydrolase n=1 Tax=Obba rivulosa TaxID=1052685 RepID=A0A8E2B291_9APHY|nr:alpha/beta-hydrolase [Obba rivulosa]
MLRPTLLVLCIVTATMLSLASEAPDNGSPSTVLEQGTFIGKRINSTDAYLGIRYAEPPVGNRRFRQAAPTKLYHGTYDATSFGDICPQDTSGANNQSSSDVYLIPFQTLWFETFPAPTENSSEDCLSVNVYTPEGTRPGANLPIVVVRASHSTGRAQYLTKSEVVAPASFLYGGGGFVKGEVVVERSIQNRNPVILVSLNYRLNAVGFLHGKQAKEANITNLGLRDQREALRWIQKYIHKFGGDHTKVTLWVNSGSISAAFQMLTKSGDSEGLFNAAWMQRGFPIPLNTYADLQGTYDILVNLTSCKGSSDSLDCLRQLPYEELYEAMLTVPSDQRFGRWQVVLDYEFIADQPETLLKQNRVARVPFVVGCTEDEGTDGALNLTTITTEQDVEFWLSNEGLPGLPQEQVSQVLALYPSDPAVGSPYGTGDMYAITPQYKRLSSIIGDLEYHSQRRFFLNETSHRQHAWSYQSKEFKLPVIGAMDLSDTFNIWGTGDLTDRLISFVVARKSQQRDRD